MNLDNAVILLAGAYGSVFLTVVILAGIFYKGDSDRVPPWVRVITCVVVSIGVVFIVANSEWGNAAIVDGHPLDKVSTGGLFLVGLFLAFVEAGVFAGLDKFVTGLSNIGFNQPKRVKDAPRPGTSTEPNPPTGDDPMPDFTGDNADVEVPSEPASTLPSLPTSVTG